MKTSDSEIVVSPPFKGNCWIRYASDTPLTAEELQAGVVQIPKTIGSVAVAYNIPAIPTFKDALGILGRYEDEINCYEEAIRIKPDYAEPWNNKGSALHNLGRYEEAIRSFEQHR